MNKNIDVINENLWAVNQWYVKQGYIKDLTILPGKVPELHDASLTNDGILILNKSSPSYEILKKILLRIMGHTTEQLQNAYKKMQQMEKPDAYEKMYLCLLEWEIKRRCVKAEYAASLSKPTLKDKIILFLRKVGDSGGIHSDRD